MSEPEPKQNLDLLNTEIAFSNKSDKELNQVMRVIERMAAKLAEKRDLRKILKLF